MHTQVQSGELSGGTSGAKHINLTAVQNTNTFGTLHLEYHVVEHITLAHIANANSIGALTLVKHTVRNLTMTRVTNSNTIGSLALSLIPWVPVNLELIDLLSCFDQTYPTTDKVQMDTLITGLKTAGVWTKFDWYGNAYWARSEHDALINWKNCPQALSKVGSASWSMGAGLSGVNPATSNSRYKSGWNVGDGAHSSATNFAFFSKITAVALPQDGMQPMGVWKRVSGGGPSTADGVFFSLSVLSGSGFSGAWVSAGSGDGSFASIGDGTGMWGVSHSGTAHITVKNGATIASSTVAANADYTDPDGLSVAGSAGAARRSFPGTQLYWGWGGALTAVEFAAIESAFQSAILPPSIITGALLVDSDGNYLAEADGDYVLTDGP